MRRGAKLIIGLMLALGMVRCQEDEALVNLQAGDLARVPLTEGRHRQVVNLGKAGDLTYTLAVPELRRGESVPLVIALHPATGGGLIPYYSEGYLASQVEPGLRSLGAIIAALDAPAAPWTEPLSQDAIIAFTRAAVQAWPVNPEQVVVTGYSAGGVGAWWLIGLEPDLFSAVIPVAAQPALSSFDWIGQVAAFVIHSRLDEVFPFDAVEQSVVNYQARGATMHFEAVDELGHNQQSAYALLLTEAIPWLQALWAATE